MRKYFFLFDLTLLAIVVIAGRIVPAAASAGPLHVDSPDGAVRITFHLDSHQAPIYSVMFQGKRVLEDSPLSLEFRQGGMWGPGQEITGVSRGAHDETYPIVAGKSSRRGTITSS